LLIVLVWSIAFSNDYTFSLFSFTLLEVSAKSSSATTQATPAATDKSVKTSSNLESLKTNDLAKPVKKSSSKQLKTSAKKILSPEVVPSDWDSSNEEEPKADKTISKALVNSKAKKLSTSSEPLKKPLASLEPVHKSSIHSEPLKSKETADKRPDTEILKTIHIKKKGIQPTSEISSDSISAPVPTSITSDKGNQPIRQPNSSPAQRQEDSRLSSFPKISTDSAVQKKIENYFVPQGRTVRSESTTSSAQPSLSFTTEPYEPASESDLDIITGSSIS
jgi:hypothetical protein